MFVFLIILTLAIIIALSGTVDAPLEKQLTDDLNIIKSGVGQNSQRLADIETTVKTLQTENERLRLEVDSTKRIATKSERSPIIRPGQVSDSCARYLGSIVVLTAEAHGKLNHLSDKHRDII